MKTLRLVMLGAGGHGKVVAALIGALGHELVAVLDDDPRQEGQRLSGAPIVANPDRIPEVAGLPRLLAFGDNRVRVRHAARIELASPPLVHPAAWVAPEVSLGQGTVVFAGAVVQPGVRIGAHSIVNTGATVDHDCEIGDFVHIAPGANLSGNVQVGTGAFLGVGSAVINGIRIGRWAVLGAGAVAIDDVPEDATAVGVPARVREG